MSTSTDTLNIPGLRMTKQRKEVYRVLTETRDHPTAADVYDRVKLSTPGISLATVYNCLETLVEHKAVKQVNFERESSRYCPNLNEHGHFHDEITGTIHDIKFKDGIKLSDFLDIPEDTHITNLDITLRGILPKN
ncbi:Fur family transcriptional regulator [Rubritalea profundi]|uniref:Transcriptional repressor n=1 Tax=Rubritalea profundi TaxID=1658618 RepID=A0A2S7U5Z2_9BACT|nr:transcriptional repressor [Rubritalea profundi]PQJ29742.1 transcriptional repressor [Rubritalea profundi]